MYRMVFVFFAIGLLLSGDAAAADRDQDRERDRVGARAQNNDEGEVYGWQLMTARERQQYREQMRTMRTPEQREQFRRKHHEKMQQRAKAKGLRLGKFPPEPRHKGFSSPGSRGGGAGRK